MGWYVASTLPQREKFAHAVLTFHGFRPYLPYRLYRVRGLADRAELLFPSYVLIEFDLASDPWQGIKNLPGIQRLQPLHREIPTALPEGFVEDLMRIEMELGHVSGCTPEMSKVKKDDPVYIHEGLFMDMVGKFDGIKNEAVSVLLNFFGREASVEIPMNFVRPVT